ncbi:hypothetical protein FPL02_26360 [Bacillus paranthracis]|nr:hypothetical protein FPL02_26360 [Bacillus paranthracis]
MYNKKRLLAGVTLVNEIISTIFQIYRTQLELYRRFFYYIDVSTRNIDLPTINDEIRLLF